MPNKIYTVVEEQITFQDSAGSAVLALNNLAAGAGRYSDRFDRGAGAKPGWARLFFTWQMATAGVIGEALEVYILAWSMHATPRAPGALGTSGNALTADMRRNLNGGLAHLIATVDKTTTATNIIANAPLIWIPGQYVTAAVWNGTADNLQATANASQVALEFLPQEIQ